MDYERVLGFCLIVAPLGCALLYYTPKFWECKNDVDGNLTKLLSKTTINETLPSLSSLEFEDESHFKGKL